MYTSSSEDESDTSDDSNKPSTSDDVTSTDTSVRRSQRSQKRYTTLLEYFFVGVLYAVNSYSAESVKIQLYSLVLIKS